MNFKDHNKKEEAKEILRQGAKTDFWKLIVQAIQESKEAIQREQDGEAISDLPAEQYKLKNELFKAKKEFLDALMKTPENIISWLQDADNTEKDFDPYQKT